MQHYVHTAQQVLIQHFDLYAELCDTAFSWKFKNDLKIIYAEKAKLSLFETAKIGLLPVVH